MIRTRVLSSLAVATALVGCASMNDLSTDVSTYSQWPAARKPATYVFERLPSQQARPQQQQVLEDSARRAIEAAGFVPAASPEAADVSIQLGARVTATERSPFEDPFWFGGLHRPFGYGYGYGGRFWGPGWRYGWASRYDFPNYEREVGLLIRDRKTGQPLYEASANSDGTSPGVDTVLPAMFAAALKDFPSGGTNPRRVTVEMAR